MSLGDSYKRLFSLGKKSESEMDDEIAAHIQLCVDDLVRQGLSPESARAEAARRFGNLDEARVRLHSAARQKATALRQRDWWESLAEDARYAIRRARRSPGFTALSLATLAIGIGITTATFTLVEGIMLRPLPFAQANRLVALASLDSAQQYINTVSSANWLDWKRETKTLESTALYFPRRVSIVETDGAARVPGMMVSGNFFDVLKVPFTVGRGFTEAEADANEPVVVISEQLWRTALGANPQLAEMQMGSRKVRVGGVIKAGYEFPAGTSVWLPNAFPPEPGGGMRNNINWLAVGRMRADVNIAQTKAELDRIAKNINVRDPGSLYSFGVDVRPLLQFVVGDTSTYLIFLMSAVGFVLLIACANLAAANLARGITRSREMGMRAALGAKRGRLIQQLLVEQLILGITGGAAGMFVAWIAIRGGVRWAASELPRAEQIHFDPFIVAFAAGISVLAGLAAGLIPALRGSRTSLAGLIGNAGRASIRGGRNVPGAALVTAEVALAFVLLAGTGLFIKSFRTLVSRDLGFDAHTVVAQAALSGPRFSTPESRVVYWNSLERALRDIPGVKSVGVALWVPLGIAGGTFIEVQGSSQKNAGAGYRVVSGSYFDAIGIPVIKGRTFGTEDAPAGERVAIINRRMAEQFWPEQDPVGKFVRAPSQERGPRGEEAPWLRVVGIVGNIRQSGYESDARAELYVLYSQVPNYTWVMSAVVRGTPELVQLVPSVRQTAKSVDPLIAVEVGTFEDRLSTVLAERRMTMSLVTGFGFLALVLSAIGLYSLLSYSVAQRTRELAVRAALGARRGEIITLVLTGAGQIVLPGMVVGVLAAAAIAKAVSSVLVDVSPTDPGTYIAVASVLMIVAFAAAAVPARRAARLDPMVALQAE